jgi:carbamoylphosphate synthase large subunit
VSTTSSKSQRVVIDLDAFEPQEDAIRLVPADVAVRAGVLPIAQKEGSLLVVLEQQRGDEALAIEARLGALTNLNVEVVLAPKEAIDRVRDRQSDA